MLQTYTECIKFLKGRNRFSRIYNTLCRYLTIYPHNNLMDRFTNKNLQKNNNLVHISYINFLKFLNIRYTLLNILSSYYYIRNTQEGIYMSYYELTPLGHNKISNIQLPLMSMFCMLYYIICTN